MTSLRTATDVFQSFLNLTCVRGEGKQVSVGELCHVYNAWKGPSGYMAPKKFETWFWQKMEYSDIRTMIKHDGDGIVKGLGLRSSDELSIDIPNLFKTYCLHIDGAAVSRCGAPAHHEDASGRTFCNEHRCMNCFPEQCRMLDKYSKMCRGCLIAEGKKWSMKWH